MAEGREHEKLQHHMGSEWAKFCPSCGGRLKERYIEADLHSRKVCSDCGFIFYLNPKVVAGTIPRQDGRLWLVRRNIEPALDSWTFPGGYVDLGERVTEAAQRETYEETRLHVRLDRLLNVYSYAHVGIVLVVYCATVTGGVAALTAETREIRAFSLDEIPWTRLAFSSTRDALTEYFERKDLHG